MFHSQFVLKLRNNLARDGECGFLRDSSSAYFFQSTLIACRPGRGIQLLSEFRAPAGHGDRA